MENKSLLCLVDVVCNMSATHVILESEHLIGKNCNYKTDQTYVSVKAMSMLVQRKGFFLSPLNKMSLCSCYFIMPMITTHEDVKRTSITIRWVTLGSHSSGLITLEAYYRRR